jgi:hypothetical protein
VVYASMQSLKEIAKAKVLEIVTTITITVTTKRKQ